MMFFPKYWPWITLCGSSPSALMQGMKRLVDLQLAVTGSEIDFPNLQCRLNLVLRIQVLEKHPEHFARIEECAQALNMETRCIHAEFPVQPADVDRSLIKAGESRLQRIDYQVMRGCGADGLPPPCGSVTPTHSARVHR